MKHPDTRLLECWLSIWEWKSVCLRQVLGVADGAMWHQSIHAPQRTITIQTTKHGLPSGMPWSSFGNADGAKLALWNPALGTIYVALLFVISIGDMSSITHQHLSKASMLMPPNSTITGSQVKRVCLRWGFGCLLDTCIHPCLPWWWGCL